MGLLRNKTPKVSVGPLDFFYKTVQRLSPREAFLVLVGIAF